MNFSSSLNFQPLPYFFFWKDALPVQRLQHPTQTCIGKDSAFYLYCLKFLLAGNIHILKNLEEEKLGWGWPTPSIVALEDLFYVETRKIALIYSKLNASGKPGLLYCPQMIAALLVLSKPTCLRHAVLPDMQLMQATFDSACGVHVYLK